MSEISRIVPDGDAYHIRACCGCGIVHLGVGPTTLTLSREAFFALRDLVNEVADGFRAAPEGNVDTCGEPGVKYLA